MIAQMADARLWPGDHKFKETAMTWTAPVLIEICVGLEINGYLPPEL
jgi:coenzyme PQQ precursor peptide PqqA